MGPRDIVRVAFPLAEAAYSLPVAAGPPRDREGPWAIYAGPALGYNRLGMGATEEEAWVAAAAAVESATSSFETEE